MAQGYIDIPLTPQQRRAAPKPPPPIDYDKLAREHGGRVVPRIIFSAEDVDLPAAPVGFEADAPVGFEADDVRPSPAAAAPASSATPRPRTLWEWLSGKTTEMPPDVAAQYRAIQERAAGRQPPLRGDTIVENAQTMAGYAPAVGGTVGAMLGGPVGAAIGGAAGEVVNLAANPAHRSATPLGLAGQVVGEGALMGATEVVVPGIGRALKGGAQAVYRGYLKPSLAEHLAPRARDIVETALREALPISEAGAQRAQGLITDLNQQVQQMLARHGGQIDLHAIATRVRDFARRKYFAPGRPSENYDAALKVADSIDQHASLGLPAGVRPTRVNVDLPTANLVKGNLYETAGEEAFGVATGVARKEAAKAGGRELRGAIEQQAPWVAPLNKRESALIDTAAAIARAVNREANQNALVGVKSLVGATILGEEWARTGDPYSAALKALTVRWALSPAVATKAAITAFRLGQANKLPPATALRIAVQAVQNAGADPTAAAP